MELKEALGNTLLKYRKASGDSQMTIAFRCGVDAANISRIERGHVLPSAMTLFLMAKALNVPLHKIIQDVENLSPTDVILK